MTENITTFHEPMRPGDLITSAQRLVSVSEEQTRRLGTGRFWVIDVEYRNQRGELCRRRAVDRLRLPPRRRPRRSTRDHRRQGEGRRRAARRSSYDVTSTTVVLGALGRPRLAADAPRLPLRGRAPGRAGHLPQLAEPGRVARALRHRLDRTDRPARRLRFKMRKPMFPGDTMVIEGVVRDVSDRRRRLRLGRARHHDPRRRRDLHRVGGEGRESRPHPTTTRGPRRRDARSRPERGRSMDLDFTPEQEMLREAVAGRVRPRTAASTSCARWRTTRSGTPTSSGQQLADLGLLGMTLPEEHGGSGMIMLDGGGRLHRARAGAGAVAALRELGDERGRARARRAPTRSGPSGCRAISSGEAIVTPAWLEPVGGFGPKGVQLAATADGDGWRLDGVKRHVAFAKAADRLLVLARTARRARRCSSSTRRRPASRSPS